MKMEPFSCIWKECLWGNEREKDCFCEEEMGKKRAVWLLFLLLSFAAAKGEREKFWGVWMKGERGYCQMRLFSSSPSYL